MTAATLELPTDGPLHIGGLFEGYSGLTMGAAMALGGGELTWYSEIDPGALKILGHRHPTVPNLGDVSTVDWALVPRVHVLCGGFPCQDVSAAGKRAGLRDGTRSGLWHEFVRAIDELRPPIVLAENVRGLLTAAGEEPGPALLDERTRIALCDRLILWIADRHTRAVREGRTTDAQAAATRRHRVLGLRRRAVDRARRLERQLVRALAVVLGTLADLGYDAAWHGLRAADIGAPHGRWRVFILAWPVGCPPALATNLRHEGGRAARRGGAGPAHSGLVALSARVLPTPTTRDVKGPNQRRDDTCLHGALLPTPRASDGEKGGPNQRGTSGDLMLPSAVARLLPTPVTDPDSCNGHARDLGSEAKLLPTPVVTDSSGTRNRTAGRSPDAKPFAVGTTLGDVAYDSSWGEYAAAIKRWEALTGQVAPAPTRPGTKGQPQLSPAFVEWMMGLPAGWITDVPGITRNEALKACGNGVVPQQAAAAVRWILARIAERYELVA